MFLKEFLPDTRPVALNELQTLRHLQGHLPLRKWHAATAAVATHQPFVPLLGECSPCKLTDIRASKKALLILRLRDAVPVAFNRQASRCSVDRSGPGRQSSCHAGCTCQHASPG